MVEAGADLITLQAITGHKTLDMLRRYSHPSDTRKLELVQAAARHTTATQPNVAGENPHS